MRIALSLCLLGVVLGCTKPRAPASPAATRAASGASVWSLDLVRTRPGQQAEYLRGIRANWAGARRIALEGGEVRAYHAFAAPPDSTRGWDVVLLTEYRDSSAFSRREATFQRVFADPRVVAGRVVSALPSDQVRMFVASEVALTSVASSAP
jgi:hypothetical protein